MPPQRAGSLLNQSDYQDAASILHQLVDGRYSPIQLAAISNYKLAQLTFAPPDIHSLRKTAVIKNTAQYIYDITPKEWLDEMTRWEFFTLEALDDIDMTQEGLETILSEYVQIMDSFKTFNKEANIDLDSIAFQDNCNDNVNDDDNSIQRQQQLYPANEHKAPERSSSASTSSTSTSTSTSNTTQSYVTTASSISFTPLATPPARQDIVEQHRKSFRLNQHRISWTSDTGLPSFAASQHLAGELMSLFDMEFKIDISLDPYSTPAPQLPELSYFQEKQKHRSSVDSFMCLIPAFESFQIDSYDGLSFVSKANKRTSSLAGAGIAGMGNGPSTNKRISSSLAPARSSSLKYKNGHHQSNRPAPSNDSDLTSVSYRSPYSTPTSNDGVDDLSDRLPLTKKKSIRKLVSLFGKKRLNSETALPLDHQHQLSAMPLASMSTPTLSPPNGHTVSTYNAITPSSLAKSSSTAATPSPNSPNSPAIPTSSSFRIAASPTEPALTSTTSSSINNTNGPVTFTSVATHAAPDPIESTPKPTSPTTTTTRAQRRRSNSVPGISTSFLAELSNQQDHFGTNQQSPMERSDTVNAYQQHQQPRQSPQQQQSALYPLSFTTANGPGTDKQPIPQSVSVYELGSFGRLERKQSLSNHHHHHHHHHHHQQQQQKQQHQAYNQHHIHQTQQYQNQPRQEMRQYHSTHDLSQMYSTSPTGSKDSMALSSPTSPKKSSSSFLQRMTTFARRKKQVNNPTSPSSPVPV